MHANHTMLNKAKCNLGKVNLEPMQSAVSPFSIRDLWGDLMERVVPGDLLCSGSLYMLVFADQ